jgi:hypothetical protein
MTEQPSKMPLWVPAVIIGGALVIAIDVLLNLLGGIPRLPL